MHVPSVEIYVSVFGVIFLVLVTIAIPLFNKTVVPVSDKVEGGFIVVVKIPEQDRQELTKVVTKVDKDHCYHELVFVYFLKDAKMELVFQVSDGHEIVILIKNGTIKRKLIIQ